MPSINEEVEKLLNLWFSVRKECSMNEITVKSTHRLRAPLTDTNHKDMQERSASSLRPGPLWRWNVAGILSTTENISCPNFLREGETDSLFYKKHTKAKSYLLASQWGRKASLLLFQTHQGKPDSLQLLRRNFRRRAKHITEANTFSHYFLGLHGTFSWYFDFIYRESIHLFLILKTPHCCTLLVTPWTI